MSRTRRFDRTFAKAALVAAVVAVGCTVSAPSTVLAQDGGSKQALGSMFRVVNQIGARELWKHGITGQGINVAVIDTGVAPVAELRSADKVVAVADLSAEAAVPEATYLDTYGHGTHIAGIIAGKTPGADPAQAAQHPEWFMGVAPDAGIVSVKVADNTGAADISQVIAGVDWVVDHAATLHIRVLNLSYTSHSPLPY
ncbi:MAG: S8 family serine peptidase, partial [Actinomycetota bacterium]